MGLSAWPSHLLSRLRSQMLLQVEHLMQVGDVVDRQDGLDFAEGAEGRVGHDRA